MSSTHDHRFAKETIPVSLEEEMRKSYLDYAMSVIVGRALPDVRDGLKPVHRRVLYAMHELKNNWNSSYKKSARIVGDVIGKYHPHGDSAVYDTIVRMAQPFSMRYMLVDGQGNFGSVDGDGAAAMRYTEIRMAKIAHEMLADIEEDTVNFGPNYDGSEQEPLVMPTRFPALLTNGSAGIAVGMATNIPPHNLGDTVDACLQLLADPDTSIDALIDTIKAPDFPTGATIYGLAGVREGYRTGRGRVVMRGKTHIEPIGKHGEREAIIIDEIPYQVNKAKLVEKIGELVREKTLEGISDLRDESDKSGMRVVIELKRNENAEVVLNQLYKLTQLQDSFGINMVALVDGQPRLLNLKQILAEFLRHRREVVTRRTLFRLKKARHEGHIAEGKAVALSNIDPMIQLIKESADAAEAKAKLLARPWQSGLVGDMLSRTDLDLNMARPEGLPENLGLREDGYYLSDLQADAILRMSLRNLTGLDQDTILADYKTIMAQIIDFLDILAKPERITQIIHDELIEIKTNFGDPRRSEINPFGGDIADEDLIPPREMVVTLTHGGYIKTQPTTDYQAQRRGGRGKQAAATKDEDFIETLFVANTHDYLMCFTNHGRCHWIKVYKLPEGGRNSRGRPINNVIQLDENEKVSAILPVRDFPEDEYVFFATAMGVVKKVQLSAFKNVSKVGIKAIALKEGDSLVGVARTSGRNDIMLFSNLGKAIRFNEYWERSSDDEETGDDNDTEISGSQEDDNAESAPISGKHGVRPSGRGSGGLRGMRLPENGRIVSLITFAPECEQSELQVLTATANGYGKRTPIASYSRKNKGGQGNIAINTGERNGDLVAATLVSESDDLMLITSGGVLIRTKVEQIRETGRAAAGVKLINLDEGETLVSLERVAEEEEDEAQAAETQTSAESPSQEQGEA
ncbi:MULTISPECIES: DNA gyrase subunit A [Eikenella]|uniref:DNA gyrase subunit A n=1 Tax=Eikenella corrodens TaxID=539 RepID=A0A1A9RQI6_EIKCO|nr:MULTISPECIES: DNA gyrase subunit A [Eikenella]OAM14923.1 DNA gyrase subunit A [Eikenella corrodens]OAM17172.1 DNA gyrase subunit A [Eikenella corrodens]OAM22271.1 DNA gyrase subunit A [Eikenella corrodens]OFN59869.1 DNA gyrase subunit A [Eikenella sp. HMSC061C02]OWP27119.1 DNA gyrase subunit A [Eikenella corrodens]